MAELFAVVSAGIGVAAFTLQVADKIERLKATRQLDKSKAEEELEFLIQRLERLRANLQYFESQSIETTPRSGAVNFAVSNCQSAWSSVDTILQKVAEKLARRSVSKLKMGKHAGDIKEDLRQARERVDSVIHDLSLAWSVFVFRSRSSHYTDGSVSSSILMPHPYRLSRQELFDRHRASTNHFRRMIEQGKMQLRNVPLWTPVQQLQPLCNLLDTPYLREDGWTVLSSIATAHATRLNAALVISGHWNTPHYPCSLEAAAIHTVRQHDIAGAFSLPSPATGFRFE